MKKQLFSKVSWIITNFTFVLPFLSVSRVTAFPMNSVQVKSATETWVANLNPDGRPGVTVTSLTPYFDGGDTVAFIAVLSDSGFCLCGADNDVAPVYLYSPAGAYSEDNSSLRYVLREISMRTKYFRTARATASPELITMREALDDRARYWSQLSSGRVPAQKEALSTQVVPSYMTLRFTSQWDQVAPWNLFCPELAPGERTLVGCVATALGQVMYYWKWPASGIGSDQVDYHYKWRSNIDQISCPINPGFTSTYSGRLLWSPSSGGMLGMTGHWDLSLFEDAKKLYSHPIYLMALEALHNNLSNSEVEHVSTDYSGPYEWDIMEDHPSIYVNANNAMARICVDAGIGSGMSYGVMGSGAYFCGYPGKDALDVLENHFKYDDDAHCTDATISNIAYEIKWLRPALIEGDIPGEAGHVWVAIGYDYYTSPDRILMNMGWGGFRDAWYTLDSLPLGLIKNRVIADLAPEEKVKFVGGTIDLGDGTPDDPYAGLDEAVEEAPSGSTLIYPAGWTDNLLTNPLVISKKLLIKGKNVIIE